MLFLKRIAVLPFTLLPLVRAQSGAELLQQAAEDLPKCALRCLVDILSTSICGPTDVYCVWNNPKHNEELVLCVRGACTVKEALTAKNISYTALESEPRDHTKLVSYNGLIGGGVAVIAVILRIFARTPCCGGTWGNDDWAMLATMVPTLPITALSVVLANDGLGKDMWTVPFDKITNILRVYYMDEVFYILCIAMTKISILLFYLRIFPERRFRRMAWATLTCCVLFIATFVPALIAQCNPISLAWDRWDGEHEGKCINLNAMGWAAAAINIVLDLAVIILPIFETLKLRMSMMRKVGIGLMFAGGLFVTIVSILRLRYMIQFANSENITWDYVPIGYWSTLEIHVGIVIACLPALRALQHRLFPGTKKSTSYYASPVAYGTKSHSRSQTAGYTQSKSRRGSSSRLASKFGSSKRKSRLNTQASQASMMRSRNFDQDCYPMDEYNQFDKESGAQGEAGEVIGPGRGATNTLVGRGDSSSSDEAVLLEDGCRSPHRDITVKTEYSVNVEYAGSGRTTPKG